jgi:hypothetical protein
MAGQHRARNVLRSVTVPLIALAAVAGVVVGAATSASAAVTVNSSCTSRVAGLNAPNPISVAQANQQVSPCAFDSASLADLTVTLVPGVPLVNGLQAGVHAVKSTTSFSFDPLLQVSTVEAQTDAARVQVLAPGLVLEATGVHSQAGANLNAFCGGAASGDSWLASLTLNGKPIQVGNGPLTIKLGLRIAIYVNQQIHTGNSVTQRALFIQFSDKRYSLVVGEAEAGLSSGCG